MVKDYKHHHFFITENVVRISEEKDIKVLLNLLRLKEPEAYIHSLRVASFMDEVFHASDEVLRGALLHDIGKLSIPFNLTLFPRPLTENEKNIVNIHTFLGVEILSDYSEAIIACVKYHHDENCTIEYVKQLRACDIFDALINNRPYRSALALETAIDTMVEIGIHKKYIKALSDFQSKQ